MWVFCLFFLRCVIFTFILFVLALDFFFFYETQLFFFYHLSFAARQDPGHQDFFGCCFGT